MKKILLTFVLLVGIAVGLFAQKLTYQAVIRDNNQQLVTNTSVKATVTITFSTGNPYSEEVNGSTNIHGLLSFEFGGDALNGRNWEGATIAVKVVKANDESTVYVNDGARPVSAVPYALSVNGQSIQNYLTEHNYVDLDKLKDTLNAYPTTAVMDGRHYLTSDSTVIRTMQSDIAANRTNISTNATNIQTNTTNIGNLILHTARNAIRDSVAGQIHDSIADLTVASHNHSNKALLDTYDQTNANLADAVTKRHAHENADILNNTTATYTDADSIKLKGIENGAQKNVNADWAETNEDTCSFIRNKPELFSGSYNDLTDKPSIKDTVNTILTTDGYVTETTLDGRHYLTSDSTVIRTMQSDIATNRTNISTNATNIQTNTTNIGNLILHTAKNAIRDSVAGQIHDSISNIAARAHTHENKALLDTYDQTNANLADAVTKRHAHENADILNNTTATYTDADSIKLKGIENGAQKNVNADWAETNEDTCSFIRNKPELFSGSYNDLTNKPSIKDTVNTILTTDGYVSETTLDSRHYLTSDSTVITTMQGNIATNANNITTNANNIAALANRVNTFNTNVCDSVATCIGNAIDARGFLTSDSAVITTMQGNIANLTQHTTKSAIRDSVAGQIHDSIADIAAKSHTHGNKDLLDTYNQTNADLADAVAKKHAHDNAAVLAATTAPYTDADSIKLKGIAEGAEVNVQADWNQSTTTADDYIKNKPTIPTVPTNVSAFSNDAGYLTNADVTTLLSAVYDKIDSLAHLVDSLSNLPHGGGGTPTVADGQPCPDTATVSDVDGNTYNTVKIGNQCWMKENLRTTTKRNNVGNVYTENTTAGYNAETYGYYYDWEAVMQNESGDKVQGICPTGWHVPTWAEYLQLTDYVNSQPIFCCYGESGKISKALASSEGWASVDRPDSECCIGNVPARNNWTRFSLMPAGYYHSGYRESGMEATIWSATDLGSMVHVLRLFYANDEIGETLYLREMGCSVRCLRDAGVGGGTTPSAPATMSCEQVMECMGDTLGKLNTKIDSLAHIVDSLSNLTPGGGDTPTTTFTCGTDSIKDVDNNWYHTVKIGNQCWTKENLRTTKYANGTAIAKETSTSTTTAYRYYPNNDSSKVSTYGYLYNWKAVMDTSSSSEADPSGVQGICPVGWHVPSGAEWDTLTTYVYNSADPNYKCSDCSTSGWGSDMECIAKALSSTTGWNNNTESGCNAGNSGDKSNATGFSAVPAGYGPSSDFDDFGRNAYFWSATGGSDDRALYRYLSNSDSYLHKNWFRKTYGFSVRCLRDAGVGGGTTPSAPGGDNACCSELGARLDSLEHVISSQDSTINALNEQVNPFTCGTSKVKDVDLNEYNTVAIGNQCWMAQNLRTNVGGGVYPKYPEDHTKAGQMVDDSLLYGRLYTWNAMMNGAPSTNYPAGTTDADTIVHGICPAGWHVPSDAEWSALTDYLETKPDQYKCGDDAENIANALSAATGWSSSGPCTPCDGQSTTSNKTGFSAVPAGGCYNHDFYDFGRTAFFWSATQDDEVGDDYALFRSLLSFGPIVATPTYEKVYGFSVRCLRDAGVGGGTTPSAPATMSCEQVMECMGDTLGKLNTKIEEQGTEIETLNGTVTTQGQTIETLNSTVQSQGETITTQGHTIDSLAQIVDSLSNLPHGGGDTPTAFTCGSSKVKDVDLNEYNTVKIGDQCWMKENLRTTKYSDNTSILQGNSLSTDTAYWYYPNDDESNKSTYGLLYNWKAVMNGASSIAANPSGVQGICPDGWHVPSNAEWMQLTNYVSSQPLFRCSENSSYIAKALASVSGWEDSSIDDCAVGNNISGNNATGFSAMPAGSNSGDKNFGSIAFFWTTTTEYIDTRAVSINLDKDNSNVSQNPNYKKNGYSVRCLRDAGVGGGDTTDTPGSDEPAEPCTPTSSTFNIEITPSQLPYVFGDTTFSAGTTAGTYTLHRTNAGGCDSTITISINLSFFTCGTSNVKDVDNNEYNTVAIGNQCWTKENMKTTKYADGTSIDTSKMFNPGDNADNVATYGLLYTWSAATRNSSTTYPAAGQVKVQGICPTGWHVPSDAEWDTLTRYVSSKDEYKCGDDCGTWQAQSDFISCIAKALSSTTGWSSNTNDGCNAGNTGGKANATGFAAVPAGPCFFGNFNDFGSYAYFWSATHYGNDYAWYRFLGSNASLVYRYGGNKDYGFSVRCLRDAGVGGGDTPDTPGGGETAFVDTVFCYPNLGANTPDTNTATRGENFNLSSVTFTHPVETNNWEIASWNTSSDGTGTSYATNDTITTSDNLTLYAQWRTFCTGTPSSANEVGSGRIDSLKDVDNNKYAVVQIGNQCWMKENLRTTTKRNGVGNIYTNNTQAGYNAETYGYYYDWAAVMQGAGSTNYPASGSKVRGICPEGWHVPSDAEWDTLTHYVFSKDEYKCGDACGDWIEQQAVSCIAKALASTTGWSSNTSDGCNAGNTGDKANATGFAAVPAGRYINGTFPVLSGIAYFWSATQVADSNARSRDLGYNDSRVRRTTLPKDAGHSVRCLRD